MKIRKMVLFRSVTVMLLYIRNIKQNTGTTFWFTSSSILTKTEKAF